MKALYSRAYLDHISFNDMLVPFERYLFKLEHERKKIPKLKFHERDFLFRAMHSFYEASGGEMGHWVIGTGTLIHSFINNR